MSWVRSWTLLSQFLRVFLSTLAGGTGLKSLLGSMPADEEKQLILLLSSYSKKRSTILSTWEFWSAIQEKH